MSLNYGLLKRIFVGGGAAVIALSATPVQASSLASLQPEFSSFEGVEFDRPIDLETAETQAVSVDLVEMFAETLILTSDSPTSEQTLPSSFSASPEADSPETWVATADSLMPLGQGVAVEETVLAAPRSGPVLAQVRPANQGDGWEFVLQPYIFVPFNVTTNVTVDGITESVSTGLGDVFNLDRIFSGILRFEARHPQYGFFADVSHIFVQNGFTISDFPLPPLVAGLASLRTGQNIPPGTPLDVNVTATGRTTTVNLGGYYRAVDQFLGTTATNAPTYPRLLVDPYLGLGLVTISGSLAFDVALGPTVIENLPPLSNSATLIKPVLGLKLGLELSDRWTLGLGGNISGLAMGADESFAWNVLAATRYRFTNTLALQLAYQYKNSRYRLGEGITQFGLNQSQNGLLLGLDLTF